MSESESGFAVMRWLDDGNRLSVRNPKQVVEPKIPIDSYRVGMCGVSLYKGYRGMWKFRILAVGGKKELSKWLNQRFEPLMTDVTDSFCQHQENEEEDRDHLRGSPRKSRSPRKWPEFGDLPRAPQKSLTPRKLPEFGDLPRAPQKSLTPRKLPEFGDLPRPPRKSLTPRQLPEFGDLPRPPRKSLTPRKLPEFGDLPRAPRKSLTPRKLPEFEKTIKPSAESSEINDATETIHTNYLSRSVDSKKVSSKETHSYRKLEEEVTALRRKYRKIEERLDKLEETSLANEQSDAG